jgi:hypothetical protein
MKKSLIVMSLACLVAGMGLAAPAVSAENLKHPNATAQPSPSASIVLVHNVGGGSGDIIRGGASVTREGDGLGINVGLVPGKGLGLKAAFLYPAVSPPPDGVMRTFMNYSTGTGSLVYRKGLEAKNAGVGPS